MGPRVCVRVCVANEAGVSVSNDPPRQVAFVRRKRDNDTGVVIIRLVERPYCLFFLLCLDIIGRKLRNFYGKIKKKILLLNH